MSDPVRRWVELPLREVISIHHGFWMCLLCARPGQPGAGRYWDGAGDAEAAGFAHLEAVHQSPASPVASPRSSIEVAHAQHVIEGSHDPDCPRCPVLK